MKLSVVTVDQKFLSVNLKAKEVKLINRIFLDFEIMIEAKNVNELDFDFASCLFDGYLDIESFISDCEEQSFIFPKNINPNVFLMKIKKVAEIVKHYRLRLLQTGNNKLDKTRRRAEIFVNQQIKSFGI